MSIVIAPTPLSVSKSIENCFHGCVPDDNTVDCTSTLRSPEASLITTVGNPALIRLSVRAANIRRYSVRGETSMSCETAGTAGLKLPEYSNCKLYFPE